jgi:hypothetical protein
MSGTKYTAFQSRDTFIPPWFVYSLNYNGGYKNEICRCKKRSDAVKIRAALNFIEAAKRSHNSRVKQGPKRAHAKRPVQQAKERRSSIA